MSLFFYSPLLKDAPKEETIEEVYEMVLSKPFKIDTWCRIYKPSATKTLHDSCVAPLSLSDLSKLSNNAEGRGALDLDLPLSYGHVLGSPGLRETIANLYKTENSTPVTWNDVVITTGTISANFLVLDTLLAPGDHVICQYPTYQQLYEVPKRAGAEVALWKMREENSWVPDVKELAGLVKTNTKMIILNNPANPTGAVISASILNGIVEFAKSRNIIILCDEVFSPLFFDEVPPSILSMGYSNVISTRSLSKGFSLPGIRVGWIASPNKAIMTQVADSRDYTTIAVSQLDDQVANFALSDAIRPRILERSIEFCKANIAVLEKFVEEHQEFCSWIKPNGSATAFIKISKNGIPVDDAEFCRDVLKKVKLLLIPGGHAFGTEGVSDFKGYIRIGFVYKPDQFIENIGALSEYLRSYF